MTTDTITIYDNEITYNKTQDAKFVRYKNLLSFILSIIFIIISTLIFMLQIYDWDPITQLNKFRRIKNNIGNWRKLIIDKTAIEIKRGQVQSLRLKLEAYDYQCYDYGSFYVAIKLNSLNFLPSFIMRGNGDVWQFKKAEPIDVSAKQFCEYIIYKTNNIEYACGIDMYDNMGFSGWFEYGHPCQNALDSIILNNE